MSTLSITVPDNFKNELKKLSKITQRKKSELLLSWVKDGLALEKWQLKRVELGIKAANGKDFVSNKKVTNALKFNFYAS